MEKEDNKKIEDKKIPIENIVANCEANIYCLINVLIEKRVIDKKDLEKKFTELYKRK